MNEKFKNIQVQALPRHIGIATNMGDFFSPSDCVGKILLKTGQLRKTNGEVVEMLMVGAKIPELNLLCYTRSDDEDWSLDTSICNNLGFETFIRKNFIEPVKGI